MTRGHERDDGQPSRLLTLVASGAVRLFVAIAVVTGLTWMLGARLRVDTTTVPAPVAAQIGPALPGSGDRLMAVLETDQLTPEYISAIERITERASSLNGAERVRSVANTLVLTKTEPFRPIATPAFGTKSTLPIGLTLPERAQIAAISRLGTSDLISADGKTMSVIVELRTSLPAAARAEAGTQFRELVEREVAAAGLPATVHFAGDAYTTAASTDGMRVDLGLLVALACAVPGLAVLLVLRRRAPVATLLAAGGAALLLASVLTADTVGLDANPLPPTHPIAQGNQLVEDRLNGTVPIEVEFAGSPDDFRKPEVLQRVDALTNWLRDEYDVQATGLSSTLRGMAGIVTGVDSVPSNPEDVATLLTEMDSFDGGVLLHSLVNDDYSRTRLLAYWPNRGETAVTQMAERFDTIAAALLTETGIAARLNGRIPATQEAPAALATDLGAVGAVMLVLAAMLGLVGGWARHRLALDEWYDEQWMNDEDGHDAEPESLFARAFHRHDRPDHPDHPEDPGIEPEDFAGLAASRNGDQHGQATAASAAATASRPAGKPAPPASFNTP